MANDEKTFSIFHSLTSPYKLYIGTLLVHLKTVKTLSRRKQASNRYAPGILYRRQLDDDKARS